MFKNLVKELRIMKTIIIDSILLVYFDEKYNLGWKFVDTQREMTWIKICVIRGDLTHDEAEQEMKAIISRI